MNVEYLRDFDGIPAGTVSYEPDAIARVLIEHGVARETEQRPKGVRVRIENVTERKRTA